MTQIIPPTNVAQIQDPIAAALIEAGNLSLAMAKEGRHVHDCVAIGIAKFLMNLGEKGMLSFDLKDGHGEVMIYCGLFKEFGQAVEITRGIIYKTPRPL